MRILYFDVNTTSFLLLTSYKFIVYVNKCVRVYTLYIWSDEVKNKKTVCAIRFYFILLIKIFISYFLLLFVRSAFFVFFLFFVLLLLNFLYISSIRFVIKCTISVVILTLLSSWKRKISAMWYNVIGKLISSQNANQSMEQHAKCMELCGSLNLWKKYLVVVAVVVREILNENIFWFNLLVAKVFAIISMDFDTFYNSRCSSKGLNGKVIHFCICFFDKLVIWARL